MIYCVEDDESGRELMLYTLNSAGYVTNGFGSSEAFWQAMKNQLPDLVILDIMLPDEDGLSIVKKLRANPLTATIPILMETAKTTEYDKVKGLDLGADDYLSKPFGMMELVSRVRALLRRSAMNQPGAILKAGSIRMNNISHQVWVGDEEISLTLKEYNLLQLFLAHPGKVFTREKLLAAVWSDYYGESRTVDVHVGTLRQKLGAEADLIQTVRGVGYRLQPQAA